MAFHETIAADESPRFEGYGAELAALQKKRGGAPARALHLKAHLGVVGELTVSASPGARAGVFAENGKSFPVYVRFSNGSSRVQSDKEPDVRGFAIKLVGVEGQKLITGLEHEQTQDFLFINEPAIPFRNPEEFMAFVRAAQGGPALLLPKLLAGVGLGRGFSILKRALSSPKVESYATHAFHTAAPIAFGGTAAKLGLFPISSPPFPATKGDDALREDLVARLRNSSLSWALRAQLFSDDTSTPIEDASVVWSGPWRELGTLTLPKQDPDSTRGQEISALVETLSFDPWHSVEAHRPLGAIMRARSVAYRHSVLGRKAAAEPKTVLSL
jgi:catalase